MKKEISRPSTNSTNYPVIKNPSLSKTWEHLNNEMFKNFNFELSPLNISGVVDGQKAHLIYSIYNYTGNNLVFVTSDEIKALKLKKDLDFFMNEEEIIYFPPREFIFNNIEAVDNEALKVRLKAINDIITKNRYIVVTTIEALLQLTLNKDMYKIYSLELGKEYKIEEIITKLTKLGYVREDVIEGKGQFAVRGGILDFFDYSMENAVRVEFFGDEVDSIREFDIYSQLSINKLKKAYITPAKETIYDNIPDISSISDLERFKQEGYFPSMDRYISLISSSTLLDYVYDCKFIIDDYISVKEKAEILKYEFINDITTFLEKNIVVSGSIYKEFYDILNSIINIGLIDISPILRKNSDYEYKRNINISCKQLISCHGKLDIFFKDLEFYRKNNYRILILAGANSLRFIDELKDRDFLCSTVELSRSVICVKDGNISKGFEYPDFKFVVMTVLDAKSGSKKQIKNKKDIIKSYADLEVGDYVVHSTHGIGQYIGMQKLEVDGVTKDYIKIKYMENDFLYVSVNQLDLVSKYIGDKETPKISRLGSGDFIKAKQKVKKHMAEFAKDLIELYAKRQTLTGFKFSEDTVWQNEFEDSFEYEETEDQIKCIKEIKDDMTTSKPMDRLLCGDVGFGKTEVAIRACFKAVMDNKQVCCLVPTTILAQQHYLTFKERMKNFPITIEFLSRFKNSKQQKEIIKRLNSGEIDVIIGTHRVIQSDVVFKDLGLLIVDEEQRFGVTHKEKIKKLKKNVDVLTLTATPIPRTLHMSLVGIRDMSILSNPPENRQPVSTYVLEYNFQVILEAIKRELARGGQVYYLKNRVSELDKISHLLSTALPDAKIAVGHGQMNEKQLEDIVLNVIAKKVDIFVCTTIIETGMDIPNVNTIIIEDADKMGLSQLYQLRGRVGRSSRQAYAYLTYRPDKSISEVAVKRLQTIKEFTEFGSGFKIAMRDLELRGAGSLLGDLQHGHMGEIGYDLYCKLLSEALINARGEEVIQKTDTLIDLGMNAYIPDNYINNNSIKIEMYKRIADIKTQNELMDAQAEIIDRFGDIPKPTETLLEIALIKNMASQLNILEIIQKSNNVFIKLNNITKEEVAAVIGNFKGQILFTSGEKPYFTYKTERLESIIPNIKIMLQSLKELHNN